MNDEPPSAMTDSELEAAIQAVIERSGVDNQQVAVVLGTLCDHYGCHAEEPELAK